MLMCLMRETKRLKEQNGTVAGGDFASDSQMGISDQLFGNKE